MTTLAQGVILRRMNLKLLKQLSEAPGVPGREERVRAILEKEAAGLFDEVSTDNLGSLIAVKKSKTAGAKKVLLACHIDEIGFYVRHIDDKGFVRIQPAGGFDPKNLQARRVLVQCSTGEDLVGLLNPSGRPIHIAKEEDKKKVPERNPRSIRSAPNKTILEIVSDVVLSINEIRLNVEGKYKYCKV